jgi:hypothetical protein
MTELFPTSHAYEDEYPVRSALPAVGPTEVVRIYRLRHQVGQPYKQVKDELGWAAFQVRSGIAIRRRESLVCCTSFCRLAPAPPEPMSDSRPERERRSPALTPLQAAACSSTSRLGPTDYL